MPLPDLTADPGQTWNSHCEHWGLVAECMHALRLASLGKMRGVLPEVVDWAFFATVTGYC